MTQKTVSLLPRGHLPIVALMGAGAVSQFGNVLAYVAIPWFVLQTGGSPSEVGLTGAASFLPHVLAGFLGGPIVDRLGFKRMSIVADLMSGVTVALIPLLYATVGLALWQLLALVFLGTLLDNPGSTARGSMKPDLARRAGLRLERLNGIGGAIDQTCFLLGPLLAGVLIAAIGTSNVLWLNVASFAVSALLVALAVPAPHVDHPADGRAPGQYFAELREGVRFVRGDRLLWALVVSMALTNLFDTPVPLVVYARDIFASAAALGGMTAAIAVGALVSTLLFGLVGHRLPRRATFVGGLLGVPLGYGLLALAPPLAVVIAGLAIMGLFTGLVGPLVQTVMQERTPAAFRARVFGMIVALGWLTMPLGTTLGGYAIEWLGLRGTLVAIAAAYLAIVVGIFVTPAFREMRAPRPALGRAAAETAEGS